MKRNKESLWALGMILLKYKRDEVVRRSAVYLFFLRKLFISSANVFGYFCVFLVVLVRIFEQFYRYEFRRTYCS